MRRKTIKPKRKAPPTDVEYIAAIMEIMCKMSEDGRKRLLEILRIMHDATAEKSPAPRCGIGPGATGNEQYEQMDTKI